MPKDKQIKYILAIVVVVGLLGVGAMFGNYGVRPKALPVIKPSGFRNTDEIGYYTFRQTRQMIFRNQLVFWGVDSTHPESWSIVESFLNNSQGAGPAFDVVVSSNTFKVKDLLSLNILPDATPEDILKLINPYLLGKKRVVVVLNSGQTSKLLKASYSRRFEYEFGKQLAVFSIVWQTAADLANLREADFCVDAEKLSFEKAETLRCLFNGYASKFAKELDKSSKPLASAVDEYGLDDYLVYVYSH